MKNNKLLLVIILSSLLAGCDASQISTSSSKVDKNSTTSTNSTSISTSSKIEDPLKVEILGNDLMWMDETLTLTLEFSKETTEAVSWTSSDETVATVNAEGVVTPLKVGTVTITVTGVSDVTVTDSIEITIKDTIIDTRINDGGWDFTGLKSDTPVLKTKADAGAYPYNKYANFKNVTGQKYYAEATFKVTDYNTGNTWNRFAIGHRDLENNKFRAYHVSRGTGDASSIKTIVMDETTVNGDVQWGTTTDRSQVWNQGGRSTWTFDAMKIATLRDGNKFYYFVNDELSWVESVEAKFDGVDTLPSITVSDLNLEITNLYATSDEAIVNEKLNAKATKSLFYPTFADRVVIDESGDKPSITFNNNDQWPCDNIKDFAAWSKGDALTIPAGKSGIFSFDFTVNVFGSDSESSYCGLTFKEYDNPKEMRTIMLGKYKAIANAWGWDGGMNIGSSGTWDLDQGEFASSIKAEQTYKVVISAMVQDNYRNYSITVDGKATGLVWGDWDKYTGALNVGVTSIRQGTTISNFEYTIA